MAGKKDGNIIIGVEIDRSDLNKSLSVLTNDLNSITKDITKTAVGALSAIGLTIGGIAKESLTEFEDFDTGMREIFTLLPGVSDAFKKQFTSDVEELAVELKRLPEDLLPSIYEGLSAGVPKDNLFEFLRTSNEAAIAGVADLESSVDLFTSIANAYGESFDDVGKISDVVFETIRLGKTRFSELSTEISDVAPIASNLGITFEEVGASIATLTSQGISTAESTTFLKNLFKQLADEGSNLSDVLFDETGKSFTELRDEGKDIADIMEILNSASQRTGKSIITLTGELRAGQAATVLAGEGYNKLVNSLDNMLNSSGATQRAFGEFEGSLGQALKEVQAFISVTSTALGREIYEGGLGDILEELMVLLPPIVDRLMPLLVDLINKVGQELIDALPELAEFAEDMIPKLADGLTWLIENFDMVVKGAEILFKALIALNALNILVGLFTNISTIVSIVSGLLGGAGLSGILTALGPIITALTGPVGLVIAGIFALGAAFKWLYDNNILGFADFVDEQFSKAAMFISEFTDNIKEFFTEDLGNFLIDFFTELPGTLLDLMLFGFLNLIPGVVDKIKGSFKENFGDFFDFDGFNFGLGQGGGNFGLAGEGLSSSNVSNFRGGDTTVVVTGNQISNNMDLNKVGNELVSRINRNGRGR